MYHFCTITTADHMYKTMALYDSVRAVSADSHLHVLCIDQLQDRPRADHMSLYGIADLKEQNAADTIISAYGSSRDKLRWCMKPVFLRHLTAQIADKVIYVDNDIYFHGDYSFLFELLDTYDFLLTPHHYPRDPHRDQNWLEANFKVGLYNAGFIAVNKAAAESLDWWADCCAYRCEKNPLRGTFDDQKYLDLIPVMNERAHIVRHKGCNVAEWNRSVIKRSEQNDKVMLDEKYPLIFIHYNGTTVRAIIEGTEPCLRTSYELYLRNLQKYKSDIDPENLMNHMSLTDRTKYAIWKLATRLGL